MDELVSIYVEINPVSLQDAASHFKLLLSKGYTYEEIIKKENIKMARNYVFENENIESDNFGLKKKKSKFVDEQFDFRDQVTHHVYNADKFTKEEVIDLFKNEYQVTPLTVEIIAIRFLPGLQGGYFTCDTSQRGAFKCWHLCEDYC